MLRTKIRIEPHLFGSTAYFSVLLSSKMILLDLSENYIKQTLRNRYGLLLANKVQYFSVPVITSSQDRNYRKVRISYAEKWQRVHWRSIQSAYGKTPYFEYYADFIRPLFEQRFEFLHELTLESMAVVFKLLGTKPTIEHLYNYSENTESKVLDLRNKLSKAGVDYSPLLESYGLALPPYEQMFGGEFISGLSILDLLFNEGPKSKSWL